MTAYETQVSGLSPKVWFKFDNTSGTPTNSGSDTGVTITTTTGSPTVNQTSTVSNKSVLFDGNDGYILGGSLSTNTLGDGTFSIECWVKTSTSTGIAELYQQEYSSATNNTYDGGWALRLDAGKPQTYYIAKTGQAFRQITHASSIADGNWHHIVMTVATSGGSYNLKLYVDGSLSTSTGSVASQTPTSTADGDTQNRRRVGYSVNNTEYFNGYMDELAIYTEELTSTQISNNYAARESNQAVNVSYSSAVMTVSNSTMPMPAFATTTVINVSYTSGVIGTASADLINPASSANVNLDAFGTSTASSDFINPSISAIRNIDYSHSVSTANTLFVNPSVSTSKEVSYSASPITASALFAANMYYGPAEIDNLYEVSIRKIGETTNTDGKNGFVIGSQYTDSTRDARYSVAMKANSGIPTNGALIKVKINHTNNHVTVYSGGDNKISNTYNIYVFTSNPSTTFNTMNYTDLPAKELITTTRAVDADAQYLDLTQAFRDSRAASYGIFIEHVGEPPYSGTVYDRTEYNGTNLEDKVLYILTSEFVNVNYNAAAATATATNTNVSIYTETYLNVSASSASASALIVSPNIGTENATNVSAMTISASSLFVMPAFIATVSYTSEHLEAHSEMLTSSVSAIKNVNVLADPTTVSALIEMPEAQIGEDQLVAHMDASALFVMPTVYIPKIVSAMVTTASADIVNPTYTAETKGVVFASPMIARNAFLVEPPAYINKNADMWYRTLLAQDLVDIPPTATTIFSVFAGVNTDITPVSNTSTSNPNQWAGKYFSADIGSERGASPIFNQYQTGLTSALPKLEVGYFDNKNRRAVRLNNISFGSWSRNVTSSGRNYTFSAEYIIKTTKQNQIIAHGYSDRQDVSYYAGTQSAIGLYNGKLYLSRSYSGLSQYNDVHPLNNFYNPYLASNSGFTIGNINIADGEWHHITLQYGGDPTRFQIWVDGQLDIQRYLQGHNVPTELGYNSDNINYSSDFYISGYSVKPNLFIDQSTLFKHYLAYEQYDPIKAAPMVVNASAGNNTTAKGNRPRALMLYWFPVEQQFNRASDQGRYGEFDFETFDNLYTTDSPGSPPQKYYGWDVFPVDIQGFHQSDIINSSAWGYGGIAGGFRDPKTDNRRYVNLLNDLDLSQFDTIFFRNYPDQSQEMDMYTRNETVDSYFGTVEKDLYEKFLTDLRSAVDTGISLYVTNTKLAIDLGIVDRIEIVPDMHEGTQQDLRSQDLCGIQPVGGRRGYNDTHKNNFITIKNTIAGLTDQPTYINNDAAFWTNDDRFDFGGADKEWQKYEWKPSGLGIGETFMISDDYLYGGGRSLQAAPLSNIKAGKAITTFAPTVWNGNEQVANPYANHAVHIAVEPGDVLNGKQLGGKIFVSFTERFNGAQSYYNGPQYQYMSKDHGLVELTTDYWINRAYDTGYIDLARKNYLLNYSGNLDRKLEAATDPVIIQELNKEKYWSLYGPNIVAQQNVNISNIMIASNAQGNSEAVNKAQQVINPATGSPVGWRQEVFFTFKYSRQYPTMVIDVPSMMTRGFWWLAERTFLEGQVQRPVAFTSNAEMISPAISTVRILSKNAQPMLATATLKEASGYSPKDCSVSSLPMIAEAIITQPSKIAYADVMTASANFRPNSSVLTSSIDEVILYVYHTDPILYLREEVIK